MALLLTTCGGGASPQAGIPAPVAAPTLGAITISRPDTDGTVQIRGGTNAVAAGATVTITHIVASSAVEQTITTTADENGKFSASLEGVTVGDGIRITQSTPDGTSEEIAAEVEADAPDVLSSTPVAVAVFRESHSGFVCGTDGTDSTITVYDLTTKERSNSATIADFVCTDIAFDSQVELLYAIDETAGEFTALENGTEIGERILLNAPAAVADAAPDHAYAYISHNSSSVSVTLIDTSRPEGVVDELTGVVATLLITHPADGSAAVENPFIAVDDNDSGGPMAVVISEFSNGDFVISFISTSGESPSLSITAQEILDIGIPGGLALSGNATSAFVSDSSNNRAVQIDSSESGITIRDPIELGNDPRGMAIDEVNRVGYVAIYGDNTVYVLGQQNGQESQLVAQLQLTTSDRIGLGPTDIGIDPSLDPPLVIIANEASESVSIIDGPELENTTDSDGQSDGNDDGQGDGDNGGGDGDGGQDGGGGTTSESTCNDATDNDSDGFSDCFDSDCASDSACTCGSYQSNGYCGDGACLSNENGSCCNADCQETACADGADNDGDGSKDCVDTNCSSNGSCTCGGYTNDGYCGDGVCSSNENGSCCGTDCQETACADGQDNDGDTTTDCRDTDCLTTTTCRPSSCGTYSGLTYCGGGTCQSNETDSCCPGDCVETCNNGSDDDNDGKEDCADTDCRQHSACKACLDEGFTYTSCGYCGDGFFQSAGESSTCCVADLAGPIDQCQ